MFHGSPAVAATHVSKLGYLNQHATRQAVARPDLLGPDYGTYPGFLHDIEAILMRCHGQGRDGEHIMTHDFVSAESHHILRISLRI